MPNYEAFITESEYHKIAATDKHIQIALYKWIKKSNNKNWGNYLSNVYILINILWNNQYCNSVFKLNHFNIDDLAYLFNCMVLHLLPNPVIKVGLPMLVATLPYMEFDRMEMMLNNIDEKITKTTTSEEKNSAIKEHCEYIARIIYKTHLENAGPTKLVKSKGSLILRLLKILISAKSVV